MPTLNRDQIKELVDEGQYHSKNEKRIQPEYIKSFSIGALILSWIWILFSRLYSKLWVIILLLIPGVNIIIAIWLGVEGRRMAWEEKKWDNFDEFKQRQVALDKIAGGFLYLGIIAAIIVLATN